MSVLALLFEPGSRLMRNLRIPAKMSLMGLCLALPLAVLMAFTWRSEQAALRATEAEAIGLHAARAVASVVEDLQLHRGLTQRLQAGHAAAAAPREAAATALVQHLGRVDEALLPYADSSLPGLWGPTRAVLARLAEEPPAPGPAAAANHVASIAALRQLLARVAETSGLLLDPVAPTYLLMDLVVERMLPWSVGLAITRDIGAAALAHGRLEPAERVQLIGRLDAMALSLADVQEKIGALDRAGLSRPDSATAALSASQTFSASVRTRFDGEALEGDATALYEQGASALAAMQRLHAELFEELSRRLAERSNQLHRGMVEQLVCTALAVAGVLYLALSFYLSFRHALAALRQGVREVAGGDLSHVIAIRGRDELAEIGELLEAMNHRLSAMVADIRISAVRVGQAGSQMARGSEALSHRTEEQATALRQTVDTVGQLSAAVATTAQSAQAVERIAAELRLQAEGGGEAMRSTVQTMGGLEASSRRVAEIIGVIDGIAFQSNVLALNAAVEAARAGDAGRGFAVVATEVRRLAQRSSDAAGEIRSLIAHSTEAVTLSVDRIDGVSHALEAVVAGVQDVSQRLRGIAAASVEQSQDLLAMRESVGHLDDITRQNAQMVDESNRGSQDLVDRADALRGAVASIKLRQGSADEARALVEQAMARVAELGIDRAAAQFRDRRQGFVDRDMYVWVVDRQGRYRVHGAKPATEGQRVHAIPGIDGDRFVREVFASAGTGGGWVEYDILNLETGKVQSKVSYVMPLGDELVLGCGVYRQGPAEGPVAAAPPPAPRRAVRRPARAVAA